MICKKCAHENYCDMAQFGGHVPPITACSQFKEKSPTNADRIRAMSDKELASFSAACDASRFRMRCDTEEVMAETWRWLDWLKQEVENDG